MIENSPEKEKAEDCKWEKFWGVELPETLHRSETISVEESWKEYVTAVNSEMNICSHPTQASCWTGIGWHTETISGLNGPTTGWHTQVQGLLDGLMMASGAQAPSTLWLLPFLHLYIIHPAGHGSPLCQLGSHSRLWERMRGSRRPCGASSFLFERERGEGKAGRVFRVAGFGDVNSLLGHVISFFFQ